MAITITVHNNSGIDVAAYLADFDANYAPVGFGWFSANPNDFSGNQYASTEQANLIPNPSLQAAVGESGGGGNSIEYDFPTHTVGGDLDAISFGYGVTYNSGTDSFPLTQLDLRISNLGLVNQTGSGNMVSRLLNDLRTGSTTNINAVLTANAINFVGGNGADVFAGYSHNDTFDGGAGNDTLTGGDGVNTFVWATGGGTDTITDFKINVDKIDLTGATGINGFGDLVIQPNNGNARILLPGGGGLILNQVGSTTLDANDFIFAGGGGGTAVAVADRWYVSHGTAASLASSLLLANDSGQGTLSFDSVQNATGGSVSLGGNTVTFTATADTGLTAGGFDYTMSDGNGSATGHVAVNLVVTNEAKNVVTVATLAGDFSTIDGKGGNDKLTGGAGRDMFLGGLGNDQLFGMDGVDVLDGGDGDDRLDGGAGDDDLIGGSGDDRYIVDSASDAVTESANQGTDWVWSTATTFTLPDHVEHLRLLGTGHIGGTGNGFDNKMQGNTGDNELYGLDGADILTGRGGADTLRGGAGDDILDGGSDADDLDGGEGSDTYRANSVDTVRDTGTADIDQVVATGSFALTDGDGIERLTTSSLSAANLYGNELGNRINGNDAVNTLRGLGGDDTLFGYGGNDTLTGGLGRDILNGGADADTFVFRNGDTGITHPTADIIQDFVSGVDRIDLQIGVSAAQYAEVAVASSSFATLFNAAVAEMAGGQKKAVFVAGSTNGFLFFSTDADNTTIEQAIRLDGLTTLNAFAHTDLI